MTAAAISLSLLPVATLVLGWVLNELSQRFRLRWQRKGALGRALAELLEVRHHVQAVQLVIAEVKRRIPMSASQEIQSAAWIEHLVPPNPGLADRYNRALSELAEHSPLLAYRLRGKEAIPVSLTTLREASASYPESAPLALDVDGFLRHEALGPVEEAIRDLAWKHGPMTWWSVRGSLKETRGGSDEYREIVERFVRSLPISER
jgi:hypothetical protein